MVQIPGENVERGIVGHAEKAWQGVGQQFGRATRCAVAERSEPFRPLPRLDGYHLDGRPLGTDPELGLRNGDSGRHVAKRVPDFVNPRHIQAVQKVQRQAVGLRVTGRRIGPAYVPAEDNAIPHPIRAG